MAVGVGEVQRVVLDVTVEIEALWISEVGVGDGSGVGGPVGDGEAAQRGGVVTRTEFIQPRFGVALFGGKFVAVAGRGANDALAAKGVEVRVVEDGTGRVGNDAGGAEVASQVVIDVVRGIAAGDALAAKENVLVECGIGDAAGEVCFVEGVAAYAVPIDGAAGFLDAFAVAIVSIGDSGSGEQLILGVVCISVAEAVVDEVSSSVICLTANLVLGGGGNVEEFFVRAGVAGDASDGKQIAPGVVAELFVPAGCTRGGGRFGGGDAVEGIVAERLRTRGVAVVGDGGHVAVVSGAHTEIIGEVEDVASGSVGASRRRRAREFDRDAAGLEAIVVEERRDDAGAIGKGGEPTRRDVRCCSCVVDGASGVYGGNGTGGGIISVCDDATAGIADGGSRTGEIVLDDGGFGYAIGGAGIGDFPTDIGGDVVAPDFRACGIAHSRALADAIVARSSTRFLRVNQSGKQG